MNKLSRADEKIANILLSEILAGDAMSVDKVREACRLGDNNDGIIETVFETVQINIQAGTISTGTGIVPILVLSKSR